MEMHSNSGDLPVSTVTGNGVSATGIVGTPIPGISASIGPCGIVASGFGHEISSVWCTTTQVAAGGGGGAVGTVLPGGGAGSVIGGGAQTVIGGSVGSVGSVASGTVGTVGTVVGGSATVGNTVTGTVSPTVVAPSSSSGSPEPSVATGAAPQFTGAFGRHGMAVAALPLAIGAMMV